MAELDKAPGKFFRRLASNALAEGTALAAEIPEMGEREAKTAESGAMIRASRVATSTTESSSAMAANFVAWFFVAAGANAADGAAKLAAKETYTSALLKPIMVIVQNLQCN